MRPPEVPPDESYNLMVDIERLERELPDSFSAFVHASTLVTLLRGVGDSKARMALRSQLMRRPLATEVI